MKIPLKRLLTRETIVAWLVLCLTALSACTMVSRQSAPADISIRLTDPMFAQIASVTECLRLSASGRLHPGTYAVRGVSISVDRPTEFHLALRLPIHGTPVVTTREASGTFSTSVPLSFRGVALPCAVQLNCGVASAEVDLARTIGSLLVSLVGNRPAVSSARERSTPSMLQDLHIQQATFELKPNSHMGWNKSQLVIGPGSIIGLYNLRYNSRMDYDGQCRVSINLLPGSRIDDDRVSVSTDSGVIGLSFSVRNVQGQFKLQTDKDAKVTSQLLLKPLSLAVRRGPNCAELQCLSGQLQSPSLTMSKQLGGEDADWWVSGTMNLTGGRLSIRKLDKRYAFDLPQTTLMSVQAQQSGGAKSLRLTSAMADSRDPSVSGCGLRLGYLALSQQSNHPVVDLRNCHITVSAAVLQQAVQAKLPESRTIQLHKEMLQQRKWRYRNFMVNQITLSQLRVSKFKPSGSNDIGFSGQGDVAAQGTVDRYHLRLGPFSDGDNAWHRHNWAARARVMGAGDVSFRFVPGETLAASTLSYNVSFRLAPPDDVQLDWSGVANDLVGRAEAELICGALANADLLVPEDQQVVRKSGVLQLFPHPSKLLSSIKVGNVTSGFSNGNLVLGFGSHIEL